MCALSGNVPNKMNYLMTESQYTENIVVFVNCLTNGRSLDGKDSM